MSTAKKYAITDVETTGGQAHRDRIIEIAVIVTDGVQILDQLQYLINPERSIPAMITGITGIDNAMVADAPRFYEIAKEIVEIMEGCIFVAHNVKFDYSFIKHEFQSLGYPFNKKRLCTVKLTRLLRPGLKSYGLDNLIAHFGLEVHNRHRAMDDTLATFHIFRDLIAGLDDDFVLDEMINQGINASVLPKGMSIDEMHNIPEVPGIYYLSSAQGRILYVGKAKNIKARLFQHFREWSKKSLRFHQLVAHVHYEISGSELIALLWELHEIKTIQPEFNRAMKRLNKPYALYLDHKASANSTFIKVRKNTRKNDLKYEKIKLFNAKSTADLFVQHTLIEQHEVCAAVCQSRSRVFQCHCQGSCPNIMHDNKDAVIDILRQLHHDFDRDQVIILEGREATEKGFVLIQGGMFQGFGFVSETDRIIAAADWVERLSYAFFYPESHGIIKQYLRNNNCQVLYLDN